MSQNLANSQDLISSLEKVTIMNNRLGISTAIGLFIPIIFLVTALISLFAIHKSRKLKTLPIVQAKLQELSHLNSHDLKLLANSSHENALFAKFKRTYLNAYAPIIVFAFGLCLLAFLKAMH